MLCLGLWFMAEHTPNLWFLPAAFAFIVLKDNTGDTDAVVKELRSAVATKIAKYAVPDEILVSGTCPSGVWCCLL